MLTLPKPSKAHMHPQNFRPILLLKYMQNFSKLVIESYYNFGLDQVGFVKGRQAPDGQMLKLYRFVESWRMYSRLRALDAEKELDRIHWKYLAWLCKNLEYEILCIQLLGLFTIHLRHRFTHPVYYIRTFTPLMKPIRASYCPLWYFLYWLNPLQRPLYHVHLYRVYL